MDKKAKHKKAVILPYDEYVSLIAQIPKTKKEDKSTFSKFVGILDNDFQIDDIKYNKIINQ